MVFVTEKDCVYFAVRTGSLNVTEVNFSYSGFKGSLSICSFHISFLQNSFSFHLLSKNTKIQFTVIELACYCTWVGNLVFRIKGSG